MRDSVGRKLLTLKRSAGTYGGLHLSGASVGIAAAVAASVWPNPALASPVAGVGELDLAHLVEIAARLLALVGLFVCSAFFSSSEAALFSLTRVDLRRLRRERHPRADDIHKLLDQPRRLIISILSGNELVNIAASANLTAVLVLIIGLEEAAIVSLFVMVPLLLLFAEVTPKTIAVSNPVLVSTKIVAGPLSTWVTTVTPLYKLIRIVSDRVTTKIIGEGPQPESILQVDELRTLVDRGVISGELSATARGLIFNLLRAGGTEVAQIMTPKRDMVFLDAALPVEVLVETCRKHRPDHAAVFSGDKDHVIGLLFAEDVPSLVSLDPARPTKELKSVLRPALVIPGTKQVDEMLDFFEETGSRAALIIDEFGDVAGEIALDDVTAFIFGHAYQPIPDTDEYWDADRGAYVFPGGIKLTKFNTLTNLGFSDPRMTTLAGLVLRYLGRFPAEGDQVTVEGIAVTVVATEGARITSVALPGPLRPAPAGPSSPPSHPE